MTVSQGCGSLSWIITSWTLICGDRYAGVWPQLLLEVPNRNHQRHLRIRPRLVHGVTLARRTQTDARQGQKPDRDHRQKDHQRECDDQCEARKSGLMHFRGLIPIFCCFHGFGGWGGSEVTGDRQLDMRLIWVSGVGGATRADVVTM